MFAREAIEYPEEFDHLVHSIEEGRLERSGIGRPRFQDQTGVHLAPVAWPRGVGRDESRAAFDPADER